MARTERDFATTRVEDLVDPSDGDMNNILPGGCYDDDVPGDPIPENTGIVAEDDTFPTDDHPHDPIPENTGIVAEDDTFPTEEEPHDPHGEVYSIVAEDDGFPTGDLPPDPSDEEAYEEWWEDFDEELEEMVERGELRNDVTTMAFGEGDDAPDEPLIIEETTVPVTEPVIVDDLPDGDLPPELILVVEEPVEPVPVTEPVIVDDLPEDGVIYEQEAADLPVDDGLVHGDDLPEVDDWADVAL